MSDIIKNADLPNAAWRKLPPLGARAWAVEWCVDLPVNEFGDCEPDLATYRRKVVTSKGSAFALAKRMLPKDVIGEVSVTEAELTDPYGDRLPWTYYWENVGDPEYVNYGEA